MFPTLKLLVHNILVPLNLFSMGLPPMKDNIIQFSFALVVVIMEDERDIVVVAASTLLSGCALSKIALRNEEKSV